MLETVAETGSTNGDLANRIERGEPGAEGRWLIADRQLAGRGRLGRQWIDGGLGNFMGSTVVEIAADDPPAASLALVAALALYETVLPFCVQPQALRIKWPNDLLLGGAKLAGILLERKGAWVIVGIGVNLATAPDLAGQPVTALAKHGPSPDRDGFAQVLAAAFAAELGRWRQEGLGPMRERWLSAAHPPGTPLAVTMPGEPACVGTFDGLDPEGALRLRLADGAMRVIYAGDVMLG